MRELQPLWAELRVRNRRLVAVTGKLLLLAPTTAPSHDATASIDTKG